MKYQSVLCASMKLEHQRPPSSHQNPWVQCFSLPHPCSIAVFAELLKRQNLQMKQDPRRRDSRQTTLKQPPTTTKVNKYINTSINKFACWLTRMGLFISLWCLFRHADVRIRLTLWLMQQSDDACLAACQLPGWRKHNQLLSQSLPMRPTV